MIVVVGIGTFSTLDWDEYNQNATVARHARAVIEQAQQLLSALENAETERLAYLLTGDPQYLVLINAALPALARSLSELGQPSTGLDDPATMARVRILVAYKVNEFAHTSELEGRRAPEPAPVRLNQDDNRQKMDQIRAVLTAVINNQYKLYSMRALLARQHAARTRLVVLVGTVLLAVLLLAANFHIHKLVRAQDLSIEELKTARYREVQAKNAFETTLESIGDGVISFDVNGTIQFVNSAAERLTRWPRDIATRSGITEVFRIVDEDTGQSLESPALRAMAEGGLGTISRQALLLTKDGQRLPIDDSAAPLRDRQGRYVGGVLVFRDVSPRREAVRLLEDSEQRYRLLFESNPHPMWVYEVGTLNFLEVNQSAIEHYGYSREEFLTMTLREIRPHEDIAKLLSDTGHPSTICHTDGPCRHRKKDGSLIDVEITAHPFVFQGRDARLILAHDITKRAQLEEQLRQSQKLEGIGRLAGGVAHDFNNMLTVISGYAELLAARLSPGDDRRAAATEISSAAERASALTQQLLAFSRRQVLLPKILDLNTSVANIKKMLSRLLGEDVEVRTVLAPNLWSVSADPGQVDQILMNLAVNGRDAMERGGTLTIETANATLDDKYAASHVGVEPGEYVRLSVTDTGHGMDAATKLRLFEPFFTTKQVGQGTGLGLSTVYGIVKQSGGNIWVYSEVGQGATFAVYLPRSAAPADVLQAVPHVLSPDAMGQTILVVEDDFTVCKMISTMLSSGGYAVLSANTAEEALHFCTQASRIDLLLCDMVLPRTDGPTIARQVSALLPELPVLFMSGYTQHPVLLHAGLGETTAFLQKPFTRQTLIAKIQSLLKPPAAPRAE